MLMMNGKESWVRARAMLGAMLVGLVGRSVFLLGGKRGRIAMIDWGDLLVMLRMKGLRKDV